MHRLLLALALLLGLALPGYSATYYVATTGNNANPGTQAQPFQTIAKGLSVMSAGDALYLRGGTYGSIIGADHIIPSGTAFNPILIASYPGEIAVIKFIDINGYNTTFNAGVSYLIFDRIHLDGGFSYGGLSLLKENVHHIRFQNGEVRNVQQQGPPCSLGGPEVCPGWSSVGGGAGAHHIEIINTKIYNNGLNRLDHGIYATWPDAIIEGCDIYNNAGYAIQVYDSGCASLAPIDACATRMIIRNNTMHDNRGDGGLTLNHGNDMQVYNNVIYNNHDGGLRSVNFGNVNNLQIYNNTFFNNSGSPLVIDEFNTGTITNIQVKNNIFFGNGGQIQHSAGSNPTFATNLCGISGPGCTATGNPMFLNAPVDFRMQGSSPARNTGTTLPSVPTDIVGVQRGLGTGYDLGAYEYVETGGLPPTGQPIYLSAGGHSDTPSDSGDCTVPENPLTPRATLAGALSCMQIPGKILYIRGGTYLATIDTVTTPIVGGFAADNPTRIEGYQNEVAVIRAPVADQVVVYFRGSDDAFITVSKLTLDCNALANTNGLALGSTAHDITVQNTIIKNCYFEPVFIDGASNIKLLNSVIFGSQIVDGIAVIGSVSNLVLQGLDVHTNAGAGIRLFASGSGASVTVNKTMLHNNTGNGLVLGVSTGAVLENLIVTSNGAQGVRIATGASGARLYNSSVAANAGVGVQCDSGATSVEIKNVISFGNAAGSQLVNNCGATLATNLLTDPLFVAPPGNVQLADGSAGINTGTTLPGVVEDYAGNPRPDTPGGQFDIGAYERGQTAPSGGVDVTVRPRNLAQAGMLF